MDLFVSGLYSKCLHSDELTTATRWHGLFDTWYAQIVYDEDTRPKHGHYLHAVSCSAWRTRNDNLWAQDLYLDSQEFPLPLHGVEDLPCDELQAAHICQPIIGGTQLHVPSNFPNSLSDRLLSLSIIA